jgi:peptidyl-prolyl cis-trans isomerase A (cyclophilin A)
MHHQNIILILACLSITISASAQGQTGSAPAAQFDQALLQPANLHEQAPDVYNVKFETTAGDFVIRVTRAWAPNGADRFYNLVLHHFYDGASFFRVLPGFMAQVGISAYPRVAQTWAQASIKDDPVTKSNKRGYVTFAMAGKNTRTTQIFINYGDNGSSLDSQGFSPFGQVTDGMKVVDKLYSGYGEGAPSGHGPEQGLIVNRGRAYLEQSFPKLDSIKTATLVPAAAK